MTIIMGISEFFIDFRVSEIVAPYGDLIIGIMLGLTFFYVLTCEIILLNSNETKSIKLLWTIWLFLLNMICVPIFLYRYNNKQLALLLS